MRWLRVERTIDYQRPDSQLWVYQQKVVGWECSNCHHINWADRHPGVGCWSCQQRDEQYGTDPIDPRAHRPEEKLVL